MAKMKKSDKPAKVTLSGDLTLIQAADLRERLQGELANSNAIEVVFSEVGSVDLSLIQILCAAHRSARKAGKMMSLPAALPDTLVRLIDEGGFYGHIGCALDGRVACVWEPQCVDVATMEPA